MARGAELTKVFDTEQLETLFGIRGVRWLNPALTSARYPALYQLLVGRRRSQPGHFQKAEWASEPLAVDMEVSAENMAPRLTESFLEAQTDEWLIRFMTYVSKSHIDAFHSIPIVRLESGKHVVPKGKVGQPNAYLAPQDGSVELNGLPMVKASLLTRQDVVDFLQKDLGLGPPDLADFALTRVLPKYRKAEKEVSLSRWKKDFRIVVSGLATDSFGKKWRLLSAIKETAFLFGALAGKRGDLKLVTPSQLRVAGYDIKHRTSDIGARLEANDSPLRDAAPSLCNRCSDVINTRSRGQLTEHTSTFGLRPIRGHLVCAKYNEKPIERVDVAVGIF